MSTEPDVQATTPEDADRGTVPSEGDGQDRIDRSTIDFDPDDGLLSGTAVDGTSKIPGPHENGPDTTDADVEQADDDAETTATF
jgi:hypothetical protein